MGRQTRQVEGSPRASTATLPRPDNQVFPVSSSLCDSLSYTMKFILNPIWADLLWNLLFNFPLNPPPTRPQNIPACRVNRVVLILNTYLTINCLSRVPRSGVMLFRTPYPRKQRSKRLIKKIVLTKPLFYVSDVFFSKISNYMNVHWSSRSLWITDSSMLWSTLTFPKRLSKYISNISQNPISRLSVMDPRPIVMGMTQLKAQSIQLFD